MNIKETALEVLGSVLPIVIIILIFQFTLVQFPLKIMIHFIAGSIMVMLGLLFFLLGIHIGLLKVGELIGNALAQKGRLWMILFFGFIMGFVITLAEPNVQVLASQVNHVSDGAISKSILVSFVALGVGIFIAISLFRIVWNIPLNYLLMASYAVAFILTCFTKPQFVPISFDAGGVTTGPMTVPFILSLGIGITAVIQSKKSTNDSFGLLSLAFIGPILSILTLGVIFK